MAYPVGGSGAPLSWTPAGLSAFRKAPSGPTAHGGPPLQDRASPFPSYSLSGSNVPSAGDKRSSRLTLSWPPGHPGLDHLALRGIDSILPSEY